MKLNVCCYEIEYCYVIVMLGVIVLLREFDLIWE